MVLMRKTEVRRSTGYCSLRLVGLLYKSVGLVTEDMSSVYDATYKKYL